MTHTYDKDTATGEKPTTVCPECLGTGSDDMDGNRPLKCAICEKGKLPNCAGCQNDDHGQEPCRGIDISAAAGDLISALDEAEARAWIIRRLHSSGAHCPECGLSIDDYSGFLSDKRCVCGRCGRWFTARTGTFLQGSQLDYRQVYLMAALIDIMSNGLTPARIAEIIGVSADTVRIWIKRFRVYGK